MRRIPRAALVALAGPVIDGFKGRYIEWLQAMHVIPSYQRKIIIVVGRFTTPRGFLAGANRPSRESYM